MFKIFNEFMNRLINIELKLNTITNPNLSLITPPHPDQWFGNFTYSQHGEDLLIKSIFSILNISHPSYIDIGAHHPLNISNTALLYKMGSRGINIEANPNLFNEFEIQRPDDINLNFGVSDIVAKLNFYMVDDFSGRNSFDRDSVELFCSQHPEFTIRKVKEIQVYRFNEIIDKYANGICPDFLSIDVEGIDEKIITSINFEKFKPKVICIETIDGLGNDKVQLKSYIKDMGFNLVCNMGGNSIFIDSFCSGKVIS